MPNGSAHPRGITVAQIPGMNTFLRNRIRLPEHRNGRSNIGFEVKEVAKKMTDEGVKVATLHQLSWLR
jgi:hypothetical protein